MVASKAVTGRPLGLQDSFSPEGLSPPYVKAVYDYWREACGAAALAPLDALDPTRLPRGCLPHLCIVEVESGPLRFRVRLAGTAVVDGLGIDQTGLYFDEAPGMAALLARFEWCVRERRPYLAEGNATFAPNDFRRYRVLGLPFGSAEAGVQRILFVVTFLD